MIPRAALAAAKTARFTMLRIVPSLAPPRRRTHSMRTSGRNWRAREAQLGNFDNRHSALRRTGNPGVATGWRGPARDFSGPQSKRPTPRPPSACAIGVRGSASSGRRPTAFAIVEVLAVVVKMPGGPRRARFVLHADQAQGARRIAPIRRLSLGRACPSHPCLGAEQRRGCSAYQGVYARLRRAMAGHHACTLSVH